MNDYEDIWDNATMQILTALSQAAFYAGYESGYENGVASSDGNSEGPDHSRNEFTKFMTGIKPDRYDQLLKLKEMGISDKEAEEICLADEIKETEQDK